MSVNAPTLALATAHFWATIALATHAPARRAWEGSALVNSHGRTQRRRRAGQGSSFPVCPDIALLCGAPSLLSRALPEWHAVHAMPTYHHSCRPPLIATATPPHSSPAASPTRCDRTSRRCARRWTSRCACATFRHRRCVPPPMRRRAWRAWHGGDDAPRGRARVRVFGGLVLRQRERRIIMEAGRWNGFGRVGHADFDRGPCTQAG